MAKKYFNSHIENKSIKDNVDEELLTLVNELSSKLEEKMNNLEIGASIDCIFEVLRRSNKYIDETTPWILAKEESKKDRLETVLYNLIEAIRVCAVFLYPYLPTTSENIMKQLNTKDEIFVFNENTIYDLNEPEILFQRIEIEK